MQTTWLSLPISLKSFSNFLFTTWKKKADKHRKILEFDSEVVEDKAFIGFIIFLDNSFLNTDIEDDKKDN